VDGTSREVAAQLGPVQETQVEFVYHSLSVGPAQYAPNRRINALIAFLIEPPHEGAIANVKHRPERFVVQIQGLVGRHDREWQGRNHSRLTTAAVSLDEIIVGGMEKVRRRTP
jgi:hypothetical protein